MIHLEEDKNYYLLVDNQGGSFGGGRILEGELEVFEQFEEWADSDERDIEGCSFGDLMSIWEIDILKYNGVVFEELCRRSLEITKNS